MATVREAVADARRTAIREAAVRAFVHSGVEGVTMQQIAAEAGVTAGALYRYFPSKEDLLRDVIAAWMAKDRAVAASATAGGAAPLGRLLAVMRTMCAPLGTSEGRTETIMGLETELAAARRPEMLGIDHLTMRRNELALSERLVRQAQAAGELPPDVEARTLAALLNAVVAGLYWMSLQLFDELDLEEIVNLAARLIGGLSPAARQGA
jgi:AcrR family transcriptional regulator